MFQCVLPFLLLPELDQAEQDPDIILLSRQFKAIAMELISVLEQVSHELVFTLSEYYLSSIGTLHYSCVIERGEEY